MLNGILDWVYREGDLRARALQWATGGSPDSRRLALLQLQEARVPHYPLVDDIAARAANAEEHRAIQKAGDPDPEVRLGIVEASGSGPRWVDSRATRRRSP